MDISIIIVSWNVREKLKNNLAALQKSSGVSFEIFVVDNNSHDDTVAMLQKDFPSVITIANQENFGFAKACNQAIKQAQGKYILLLNPDMLIPPETLANTFTWCEANPQAAITGIHLVDEQHKTLPQVRRFPKLFDQSLVATKLARVFPFSLNSYMCKSFDYTKAAQIDSIRGSFFMIRRSALEILGLLDERYFVWFEEVDYCRRAQENKLEVWYTPVAQGQDLVGQSFNQLKRATTQAYFKDSMLVYFKKWQPAWQLPLLKLAWVFGHVIMFLFS